MAIAKGRSNVLSEIDFMNQTLRDMIDSIESHFHTQMYSLERQLSHIKTGVECADEMHSLSKPYLDEIEECNNMLYHARNKILISIYSICETFLADICKFHKVDLKFSLRNKSRKNYYLSDYLFSIGIDYSTNSPKNIPFVVYNVIRPLRNYLTHSYTNKEVAFKISDLAINNGIHGVECHYGDIRICRKKTLFDILEMCYQMLCECEEVSKKQTKQ